MKATRSIDVGGRQLRTFRGPHALKHDTFCSIVRDARGMETMVCARSGAELTEMENAVAAGYRMALEHPGPNNTEEDAA
jgi:hypothetical protein